MARCGCTTSCACVVRGQAPITVSGNGSVQQPYIIGLGQDGQTGCQAITACVAENLGPGLVYDAATGTIQARLSTDTGQTLRFGSDGGILGTTGGPPIPETCLHGIDSLPAAPDVLVAKSLAGLHNPYNSPYGVDYCLAHQMDMIHFQVSTSSDDVGVVSAYWDGIISGGRTSIYISQDIRQLSASAIQSVYNYAGDTEDPQSYQRPDPENTATRDDRRGGWYGWLAQRYYEQLLVTFLEKINGKAVAFLACMPSEDSGYTEASHVRGAIRGVLEYCAQNWAMIGVGEIANATTVINAGITPILLGDGPVTPDTWGIADLPYPVADVTAAGIEWIVLSDFRADSVFTAYQSAGINVLMQGNSRQSQKARVAELGIRGYMALDPVYYRGIGTGVGYRTETDPWEHRRMATGQLTHETDDQGVVSRAGAVRGRTEAAEQGLILPAGWGSGRDRPSVLCGWECPITDTDSYTISLDLKWNTLATVSTGVAKMGLLFGMDTDENTYSWPPNDPDINPKGMPFVQPRGYRAFQRQNGEIGIGVWDTTGLFTVLATQDSPNIAADVWNTYLLTVTPTQITWRRTVSGGTNYTCTVANDVWRGPYFFVEKVEEIDGTANPFEGKVRNVTYQTAG